MSMVGTLGGDVVDPGAPTTYPEDVSGGPLAGPASVHGPKVCCDLYMQHR
jgi:hypothetical protein